MNVFDIKDKENETKTQTANSWSFYQSAESVYVSTEAQLKAAEIANEGITLEYDSGNSRTTLEVIQSRSLLLEARIILFLFPLIAFPRMYSLSKYI